ncbi:hypothetical protein U9R90_18825 [Streptomyces sp. E11-3]|uniref:hypothetical protein n=1 Tax=Streptomyces sp. E11-3 TaxID=3110112 RepID=UPI0039802D4E
MAACGRQSLIGASGNAEPQSWQHMLAQLPVLTSHRKPISDDRRRLAGRAYIWTRVTELRAVWTRERHNVFHWLHKADHQPYHSALKPLLEGHAEQLAKAIDHRQ